MINKDSIITLWVGIFVFIGLLCTAYLTIRLGKLDWFGPGGYHLIARFDSVSGLKSGAFVEMAGVQIGEVASIRLDPKDQVAVVRLMIHANIQLTDDIIASIKTSGLIGDKFINISPGGSDIILEDADLIFETESAVDLEALISKYVFGGVK
ncbi:MAG: ABC transport system substrate-binding protein [Candidatus Magnetoglobus multicellularis str. Araruama]|uniref:ABC transport system substrate-binding protein n=1 Tax=Candidatus Magnetoglobus multicellularis str. Araruama TaxID=890399 RepID=A0A1V1NYT9_9BACT|nr:MAG: ABC transport system substrate-binding protein [Candidatus Magnetoglobus multicellularis str. Araruama]